MIIKEKTETCQDLFAYVVNQNQPTPKNWVDIGSRNFGSGFGMNNTVLLYENGWNGISMDIGDFKESYSSLDPNRVSFEQIDCTDKDVLLEMFKKHQVPTRVNYLSFDIDESTSEGLLALEYVMNAGDYIFNCITIEHDSYRFGTSVRDQQREFFKKYDYILVAELDLYEDWWIHSSIYNDTFDSLKQISQIKHDGGFSKDSLSKLSEIILSINQNI
jgi:hypothetical protein